MMRLTIIKEDTRKNVGMDYGLFYNGLSYCTRFRYSNKENYRYNDTLLLRKGCYIILYLDISGFKTKNA